MRNVLKTGEYDWAPAGYAVEITALRPIPEAEAARLRTSLPALLAGIAAEAVDTTLHFEMRTDAEGMVRVALAADAGAATAQVMQEMAAALQAVAETSVVDCADAAVAHTTWPLVPRRSQRSIGFSAGELSDDPVVAGPAEDDAADDLLEVLASLPGQGLMTRLRVVPGAGQVRWEAQLAVVTTGARPALRLGAALRRRFPDLQLLPEGDKVPARLILNGEEVHRVIPLPLAGPRPITPGMYTAPSAPIPVRPARGDAAAGGRTVRLGHALTRTGRQQPVELGDQERLRHIHVVGRTGTGKSSLLAAVAAGVIDSGGGALIADPHGELCDRILAEAPAHAHDRIWVIRCGDIDNPVPLNPLAETDTVRRDIAIEDVCAAFQYLFDKKATGMVGPRFRERVGMTLRALAAVHGARSSLLDVPLALADDKFMDHAVARCADARVAAWWRNDKIARRSSDYGDLVSWVNSKFETFTSTVALRGILGSGIDAIDFVEAMDSGRVILLDLSKAHLGESATRLLGFLYLSRVWLAALQRRNRELPFTVIVDEAHSLTSGSLTNMLAEGRKFGLSVVLAHQYLEQLDADLRPAVDGNVATTVAFRCAASDVGEIHRRFGGLVDPAVLMTLPDLSAAMMRTAASGAVYPHTLMVDHNSTATPRSGADLESQVRASLRFTHSALVDPHRQETACAVAGSSNITTITLGESEPAPAPAPAPRPGPRPAGARASFLDEWLTRRDAERSTRPAPAVADDAVS